MQNKYYQEANNIRDQLSQNIINGQNFVIARYGDGEFINMTTYNYSDHNCDGNLYYQEQGVDLEKSLRYFCHQSMVNKNVYIGIWVDWAIDPNSIYHKAIGHPTNIIFFDILHFYPYRRYGEIDISSHTVNFFRTLRNSLRHKLYVSNQQANIIAEYLNASHYIIPNQNCYNEKKKIVNDLKSMIKNDSIVIFSAGLASKVIMHELHIYNSNITYIDIGSSLDYFYRKSRDFHFHDDYNEIFNRNIEKSKN